MRDEKNMGEMCETKMKYTSSVSCGLTLVEIIVAVALAVILTGIMVLAFNPVSQLVRARNLQRTFHLQTIANAIRGNMANSPTGSFSCSSGVIPTTSTKMAASGGYNIAPCLVPTQLDAMPFDPSVLGAHYAGVGDFDSGYYIVQTPSGTVILSAPAAEGGAAIATHFTMSLNVQAFTLSGVGLSAIGSTTATVSWTTNASSDSQVDYGTTTSYGQSMIVSTTTVITHIVNLTGLTPATLYHFRAKSRNASGTLLSSGDYTLTTTN